MSNWKTCMGVGSLLWVFVMSGPPQTVAKDVLLKTDLETSPLADGWKLEAYGGGVFDGAWEKSKSASGEHYMVIRDGYWESPPVAVRPFCYYHVQFATKIEGGGHWSVQFFDPAGEPIVADVYDSVFPSAEWQTQEGCVRSHADAATMVVRFHGGEHPLAIDDVEIRRINWLEAAAWCDRVAAAAPVVRVQPPARRWKRLPNTMTTLRRGGKLRVVMLGDSICNDTSNSLYETLIRRRYPKAKPRVVTSVRGGTGCPYYQDENRVEDYVLGYRPDLLIIAGISHGHDVEAMRSVIRQVKAESDCEILVLTGAITPRQRTEQGYLRGRSQKPLNEKLADIAEFAARVRRMAREEKVEFFDIRAAWDEYLVSSYQPHDWFLRDPIHGNHRGKQVVGRLLAAYFEPRDK